MTVKTAGKRERTRLAKAELWMQVAIAAQGWCDDLRKPPTPIDTWPADDPAKVLIAKYGLSPSDIARICERIAEEAENRALRVGYDERWD